MFKKSSANSSPRRMIPLRYVLMPIAIIFSALIFLIIMGALAPKPAKKELDVKAPLVEATDLKRQPVTFSIRSQGNVTPRTQTNLTSEVSGKVIDIDPRFKVGGYFKKGEQMLAIDDINYRVAFTQAEARLSTARATLVEEKARAEQAKEEWLMSGKPLKDAPVVALRKPQILKVEADIKAAEADLEQAKVKLSRTKIIAPYDLMLQEKSVDIGQYVSVGVGLANVFAVDYAEVRLPIKQRDIPFLHIPKIDQQNAQGSSVSLHLTIGNNEQHWPSFLSRYEGTVSQQSRVHYVVAHIDDPYTLKQQNANNHELRVGTFVKAEIQGKKLDDIIVIPRSAVTGANKVYLVDMENKLDIVEIDTFYSDTENVYTKDTLDMTKKLVLTKLSTPIQGMTLRVQNDTLSQEGE